MWFSCPFATGSGHFTFLFSGVAKSTSWPADRQAQASGTSAYICDGQAQVVKTMRTVVPFG